MSISGSSSIICFTLSSCHMLATLQHKEWLLALEEHYTPSRLRANQRKNELRSRELARSGCPKPGKFRAPRYWPRCAGPTGLGSGRGARSLVCPGRGEAAPPQGRRQRGQSKPYCQRVPRRIPNGEGEMKGGYIPSGEPLGTYLRACALPGRNRAAAVRRAVSEPHREDGGIDHRGGGAGWPDHRLFIRRVRSIPVSALVRLRAWRTALRVRWWGGMKRSSAGRAQDEPPSWPAAPPGASIRGRGPT